MEWKRLRDNSIKPWAGLTTAVPLLSQDPDRDASSKSSLLPWIIG